MMGSVASRNPLAGVPGVRSPLNDPGSATAGELA
jgi:hypothetical protein